MFKHTIIFGLTAVLGSAAMAGTAPSTPCLTADEQELITWARSFQERAEAIRSRISSPSREELIKRFQTEVRQTATENQGQVQENMETLRAIAAHGQRVRVRDPWFGPMPMPAHRVAPNGPFYAFAWAPSPDREITRRHQQMIKAWDRGRKSQSVRQTTKETARRDSTINRVVTAQRSALVIEESRLALQERSLREAALKNTARQYAVNWLLGGHPEAYLPARWNASIRKTGTTLLVSKTAASSGKFTAQDVETLNASVRQLTDVLVSVGMGDFGVERVVEVERQIQQDRSEARITMAALTGQSMAHGNLRLASR